MLFNDTMVSVMDVQYDDFSACQESNWTQQKYKTKSQPGSSSYSTSI